MVKEGSLEGEGFHLTLEDGEDSVGVGRKCCWPR